MVLQNPCRFSRTPSISTIRIYYKLSLRRMAEASSITRLACAYIYHDQTIVYISTNKLISMIQ